MKHFQLSEFDCTHTGKNNMDPGFLERLDLLRGRCGFPFQITSGYRDKTHPEEAKKIRPGYHSMGIAADIAVSDGIQRRRLVAEALTMGFSGIGVANGFIHVDDRQLLSRDLPLVMWTY